MAEDDEEEFGQEASNFICRDFYVDDGLNAVPTVEEAIDLVDKSRVMCSRAGLKLHTEELLFIISLHIWKKFEFSFINKNEII